MYSDLVGEMRCRYKLAPSHVDQLREEKSDGLVSVSVNGAALQQYSAIDHERVSTGYAGGTPVYARWVPNSDALCLAVANHTSHIVSYQDPVVDTLQVWRYVAGRLSLEYVVKCGEEVRDMLVFPLRQRGEISFTAAIASSSHVNILTLPLERPGEGLVYSVPETTTQLRTGSSADTSCRIAKLEWCLFDDKLSLLAGLSNGYVVRWRLDTPHPSLPDPSLPVQRLLTHPGHPVTCLAVCPQLQNYFCSSSADSRYKFWDLKRPGRALLVRHKPPKQITLPVHLHWCWFWNKVIMFSGMSGKTQRYPNKHVYCLPTEFLREAQVSSVGRMDQHDIVPACAAHLHARTCAFSDQYSCLATGYECGTTLLVTVCDLRTKDSKVKYRAVADHCFLSCKARAKEQVDTNKHLSNDQDFINHYDFVVSDGVSSSPNEGADKQMSGDNQGVGGNKPREGDKQNTSNHTSKRLSAVVSLEWSKFDSDKKLLFVGYMSGIFQVLKPPEKVLISKN